jgi:hypothetical protein
MLLAGACGAGAGAGTLLVGAWGAGRLLPGAWSDCALAVEVNELAKTAAPAQPITLRKFMDAFSKQVPPKTDQPKG